jgi:hypothetical protein
MKHTDSCLYFILTLLFSLQSCTHEDYCALPVNSTANIGFYTMNVDKVEKISFNEFRARGFQNDSIINTDTTGISDISLPLSNLADSCTFIFTYTLVLDTITTLYSEDTLHFYFSRELTYLSPACGFMYNYYLNEIQHTHNLIDSVLIINPYVSTLDEENIKILF